MSIFDDLADPQGPPSRDALGRVLSRARRRRVARRATAVAIAVVAVGAIAVSAGALTSSSGPGRTLSATTTSVASTTNSTTSTTSTTTTTEPATTSTQTVAPSGLWTGTQLEITPRSLGGVELGMTLAQAGSAAGVAFDGAADSAFFPTTLPSDYPHLFVNEAPGNTVSCVGAEMNPAIRTPQAVTTPEGFRIGDTVQQLLAIYGSRAHYSPAPSGGIAARDGYVVEETNGDLAFDVDDATNTIFAIKGGTGLTPSSCNG